jgi:hypothetical protein
MSLEIIRSTAEAARPPEDFEVGKLQGAIEVDPAQLEITGDLIPAQIVKPNIVDPSISYLEAVKPGRVAQVQRHERTLNGWARSRYIAGLWRKKDTPEVAYEGNDPTAAVGGLNRSESTANGDRVARDKVFGNKGLLGDPGLRLWRALIPQASALMPLANPYNTDIIRDPATGETAVSTDTTKEWMTACTDGWEIRNRTAIMVEEMGTFLGKYAATHPGEKITVMSVAGGTALGTMQAIMRSGIDQQNVRLILLENNKHSATMALDLAQAVGFTGEIDHRDINVFKPEDMKALKDELAEKNEKVVALDAVGIAEYSTKEHRTPAQVRRNGSDYMLYNPDLFIKTCLDFVDYSGMAMIGQMSTGRNNPYFTRGIVNWPGITMRDPKTFAQLLKDGSADMSLTKLSLTPRDTYTMATIYKTRQAAEIAGFGIGEMQVSEHTVWASAAERAIQRAGCVGTTASHGTIQF